MLGLAHRMQQESIWVLQKEVSLVMFSAYTPLDRAIGRELTVRMGGETYTGMLAGIYTLHGQPMLVITPMEGGGLEQHLPLSQVVVTLRHER
jgi:hypothetical protein